MLQNEENCVGPNSHLNRHFNPLNSEVRVSLFFIYVCVIACRVQIEPTVKNNGE